MPHALCAALLVCLLAPATARAFTFAFTGAVETPVIDSADFLDTSVAPGIGVAGTYQVDLTTASTSSPFQVGPASITLQLGNYLFSGSQTPHSVALQNNVATGIPGVTVDRWQSLAIITPDLTPATNASGDFAGYAVLVEFYDFDSSIFDGTETAPIDPTDPLFYSQWEQIRIMLNSVNSSFAIDGRVQVQMAVPEPRTAALLALGLAVLAHRQRRRARGH